MKIYRLQIVAYSGTPTKDEGEATIVTGNQDLTELWAEYMLIDDEGRPTKTANGTHVHRFQLEPTFDKTLESLWAEVLSKVEEMEQ
jgi:hypothetical protein